MKNYLIVFILVLVTVSVFGVPEFSTEYGKAEWVTWTEEEKLNFVLGFGAGAYAAYKPLIEEHPYLVDDILKRYERITGLDAGVVVGAIDHMYEHDPRTFDMPIIYLIPNVKEYLDGNY